ncbi:DUF4292 domain-containing protein [Sanyastnella coralliicola]|uniref:DUF4292 domain-containing protein n=1 Tax=Sanyastnella coralliicola TaxID=3069118 RepID=UPI0027B92406|nr:DUF4292 domain-containing protein [Longitalea sp. SCSIO 12813]
MKKLISRNPLLLILPLLLLVLASGCSNERRLAQGKPLKNRSSGAILNRYYKTEFDADWIGMKISAELKDAETKQSFKANIRIRRDSVIWMSISPLLGVEVARVMITPDSLKYISKVPNDKHYFVGSIEEIVNITKTEISFEMLQSILLGNAVDLDEQQDKFISKVDEQDYLLISKYNRKLKKVVGVDERDINPDDSLEIETTDKKYRRILRKADEEDLMIKRYWFDGYTYQLSKTVFDDLYYQRSLTIEHSKYKEHDGQYYPELTILTLGSIDGNTEFNYEINRLKTNKEYDFPFDIPDSFERKLTP